ncbi:uncharacterized protein si:busm1-163l24.3 isoform X2 [Syngnathoides biaculeatus]|uniref:uncharacterized protein si:busm1-163l24.3 isoform X2 n=1 Tax=Syngnathoides biaculeatus TaxID=300417 RepID=UPI002ADD61BB|nr:uncharacterized protein si:busm1-163l24.3 isoform X2 [Syngnathoides biaculeatus]
MHSIAPCRPGQAKSQFHFSPPLALQCLSIYKRNRNKQPGSIMAEASRTVRVSGLPPDVEEERLIDKLSVHFLRSSNGGGEILSVNIDESKPNSALVQFEDSRVAHRVVRHGRHSLKVDGKEYLLDVSEHHKTLDPNKVITSLTATVDYSQIPKGRSTLTRLLRDHPDVETNCDSTKNLCRLRGGYTEVQSVLAQLLACRPKYLQSEELSASSQLTVGCSESLTKTRSDRVDKRSLTGGSPTTEEDLSLVVDADVFKYLQKRYGQDYQRLQCQHGVEVVDVTNQGITTLFLQGVNCKDGKEREQIELAKSAISELCQKSERRICQAELRKCDLDPKRDLQQAWEALSVRFPELLFREDNSCVFLIGDQNDVSEAKQFLLQERCTLETEEIGSLLGTPSSPRMTKEEHDTLAVSPSISRTQDDRKDLVQLSEKAKKSEGGKMYHLAARFKDTGSALPSPSVSLSLRRTSNPSRHSTQELRSEAAGDPNRVLRPLMRSRTTSDTSAKSKRPCLTTTPLPMPGKDHMGSNAKRTNSFSGVTQQGLQKVEGDSFTSPARARTSSLSDQHEVYHAVVLVSSIMWFHIKEVYSTQVDALTRDLQLNEGGSPGKIQSTIWISGSEQSGVTACQLALQELVDAVSSDFCVHELHLSELGVADLEDETLQACCAEVRRRFTKITVRVMKRSLYLLGPKRLCYQVGASLREVFSGDGTQTDTQKDCATPSVAGQVKEGEPRTLLETKQNSATQESVLNHMEDNTKTELVTGANGQGATRRDPVIKEKLERPSVVDQDKCKVLVHGSKGSPENMNGIWSMTPQSNKATPSPQKEPHLSGICVCGETATSMNRTECGVVMCTKCLDAVHIHCRVCHTGPPGHSVPPGVRGTMTHCKLNFSLPGHNKYATIKITYLVPDGIQKDHHPSPGKPFQGGVFEAFLPDCDKTRKLLPRLENAFRQGLTFTVTSKNGSKVTWDAVPHKTSLQGGRSGNGYPDSSYLKRLSDILTSHGIEEEASTH